MRNLAYIVLLISFCVEASDFRYNYDAELEVGSRYYGNTENCLYKMFCLPYFLDIGIEAAIVYKDGYKFNVGIRNDSICLIICADKNFMVNGYKIGDRVNVVVRPENIKISKTEKKINCLSGKIYEQIYDGAFTKILIKIGRKVIKVTVSGKEKLYDIGEEVYFYWTINESIVLGSEINED